MYLTRMAINAARAGARKLLASPHAMHAAVLSGFPPHVPTETGEGRVLWRLDKTTGPLWLYVVSPGEPDLTHMVEQAGWPTRDTWETRDYSAFVAQKTDGQVWRFRLKANPVHSVRTEDGQTKRYGHVTARQQMQWLQARAETHGFEILSNDETGTQLEVTHKQRHNFRRGSGRVTFHAAQFDGMLRVTDERALRRAMTFGIGRSKGYGCGLLTLATVPDSDFGS